MDDAGKVDPGLARVHRRLIELGHGPTPVPHPRHPDRVGLGFERDGEALVAAREPGTPAVRIVAPWDLVRALARHLGASGGSTGRAEPEERDHVARAVELVAAMPPADRDALLLHLDDRLASPRTSHALRSTDAGGPRGFEVWTRVFPFEGLGLREVDRALGAVAGVAGRARRFAQRSLRLEGEGPRLRFRPPGGSSHLRDPTSPPHDRPNPNP